MARFVVTMGPWESASVFLATWRWRSVFAGVKLVVRYVSAHTGLPMLLVAAVSVVLGYRILRRSARFFLEVAVVAFLLMAALELGWLRW